MVCNNCNAKVSKKETMCPYCHASMKQPTLLSRIAKFDEILAGLCLSAMILIVLIQIFLRNFFQTGIGGADPLVRHLVLWVVFLGAGIAAKDNSHISINFLSKSLPPKANKAVEFIVAIFSSCVLGILVYASMSFISLDFSDGIKIPLLNIPVWTMEIIIPIGYTIVAVHIIICGIKSLSDIGMDIK